MARPIDGDVLLEQMKRRKDYVGRPSDPVCIIEDAPTIDAVVVVRCKNCLHYNTDVCPAGFGFCELSGIEHMSGDDMYCSFGESK